MSLHRINALHAVAPLSADGRHLGFALLDGLADPEGKRALVLGHSAVDLVCALIREGCSEVTELRCIDRPAPGSADLALIPRVLSLVEATAAVEHAWRALSKPGVVRLCVPRHLAVGVMRILRLYGFVAVTRRNDTQVSLLSACKSSAIVWGRA